MQKKVIVLVLLLVVTVIPTILFLRSIAHILWFMVTHGDSYRITVTVMSVTENGFPIPISAIAIPFLDIVSGMALPIFLLSLALSIKERSARRSNKAV